MGGSNVDILFHSHAYCIEDSYSPGSRVSFELEFDSLGKQQATHVYPFCDAGSFSRLYTVCLKELVSSAQARIGAKLSLCLEYGRTHV